MSAKKHNSDYLILCVLGILTAAVLLGMAYWGWLQKKHKKDSKPVAGSYSNNQCAALVLYTLLNNVDINVERSNDILLDENLNKIDVLVQFDPTLPIQPPELPAIRNWVNSGGILICTEVPRGVIPKNRKHSAITSCQSSGTGCSDSDYKANPTLSKGELLLSSEIETVLFLNPHTINIDKKNTEVNGNLPKVLFEDTLGPRIVKYPIGAGSVIQLADYSFLSNSQIGFKDNSVLAANLFEYAVNLAGVNSVTFDEYHHGYGMYSGGFTELNKLLFKTTAGWSILCLIFAGILFMVLKGRQFGPRRGLQKEKRRSKLEYIFSVGATYRSARAHALTFRHNYKWFKDTLVSSLALGPKPSNNSIARAISNNTSDDAKKYKTIFDQCDLLAARKKISERQLLNNLKKLSVIETEIINEP